MDVITNIILVRHAQSVWNEIGRWQGHADPPLAESGREQARAVARRLGSWPIDAIYSSDLIRAVETAQAIGEATGLEPIIDPRWRERGFGAAEGLTAEEIAAQYPEAWASRAFGPISGMPGAENHDEVVARSRAACADLLYNHAGQTVVVVSHGGMILTTLMQLLGLPHNGQALLSVGGNTSISRVTITNGHARLTGLNDTAHLELLRV